MGKIATQFGLEEAFGFFPRFTRRDPGETLTLDFSALNTFFRAELFLGGSTAFREIRRVCPEPTIVGPRTTERKAAVDAYIDLFRQAVCRLTEPETAMGLSGGADSRHIILELHTQNKLPNCVLTVDIPGRPSELAIARRITEQLGIRHTPVIPNPSMAVSDELYANRATSYMLIGAGWLAEVARRRTHASYWDGIAGDVMSAGLFLSEWGLSMFEHNRLDELADRLVSCDPVPFFRDQSLFPRADAVDAVRRELSKHTQAANPVGSFYFWNRTRIQIAAATFGLLRPWRQATLAPYLDRDLWFFLASLPARMLLDHSFHRETISKAYPQFSSVPYFEKKCAIPARDQRTRAFELLRYIASSNIHSADAIAAAARTVRSLIFRSRRQDLRWLLPTTVYCLQILRAAGAPETPSMSRMAANG